MLNKPSSNSQRTFGTIEVGLVLAGPLSFQPKNLPHLLTIKTRPSLEISNAVDKSSPVAITVRWKSVATGACALAEPTINTFRVKIESNSQSRLHIVLIAANRIAIRFIKMFIEFLQ